MRLILGGERGCRCVWLVIKVGHSGHVTEHAISIIGIYRFDFKVFLEVGDCRIQDIVDLLHLVSLDIPVFGMGVSEASPN